MPGPKPRLPVMLTKTCCCGKEFQVPDSAHGRRRSWCSRDCTAARIEIGRKGGQTTVERLGTQHLQEIGTKGGTSLRDSHGREYYQAIGRKGAAVRTAHLADNAACIHQWQLDAKGRGTCQLCGETKDFGWRVGA